jgi:hypothetical protein
MKAKIALLCLYLSGLIFAQQSNFIIGADWLNPNQASWVDSCLPMSEAYWDTIKSLNLNFGSLSYNNSFVIPQYISNIKDGLDKANTRGIKIELDSRTFPRISNLPGTRAQRWMYQIEGNMDFAFHNVGE